MTFNENMVKLLKAILMIAVGFCAISCASREPEEQCLYFDEVLDSCDGDMWATMKKLLYITQTRVIDSYTIEFSADKIYNLPKSPLSAVFMDMRGLKNVTVNGNGATVKLDAYNGFLSVVKSKNIVVKNFNVTYDRIAFTQGEVSKLDVKEGSFVLKIQNGYPHPPSDDWAKKTFGAFAWEWGNFFQADSSSIKKDAPATFPIVKVEALEKNSEFKIFVSSPQNLKYISEGDKFVMPLPIERNSRQENITARRYKNINSAPSENETLAPPPMCADIFILDSANVTVDNVNISRSRMTGAIAMANTGKVVFENCSISPFGEDLISSWRYGILLVGNKVGPIVNNCTFVKNMDDAVVFMSQPAMISKILEPRKYELTGDTIEYGDNISVFYPDSGNIAEDVRIVAKKVSDEKFITTDRPIASPIEGSMRRVTDAKATQIYNMDKVNSGFGVSNCRIISCGANAISASAQGGMIVANRIESARGSAISLGNESGVFFAGPFPKNIFVVGNDVSNCSATAMKITLASSSKTPSDYEYNIEVRENKFILKENSGLSFAEVNHGKKVKFINNEFFNFDGVKIPSSEAVKIDVSASQIDVSDE